MNRFSSRKSKKQIPFDFVLDQLEPLSPVTKPFFGCTAVYIGEKIVLILRDKSEEPDANGVWLATTHENHASLRSDFPLMRSIRTLGEGITGWQLLHVNDPDFEASVRRACEMILSSDPRIGKVPKQKSTKPTKEPAISRKRKKVIAGRAKKS